MACHFAMIAQPLLGRTIQGLNDFSSAAGDLKPGTLLASIIAVHNHQAEHNTLRAQYQALIAHMDAANVTGLGNSHVANYSASASTASAPSVGSL
jgi:hypothetical protein